MLTKKEKETLKILSDNGPDAARKLAELLESEKPDIARKAALDIIKLTIKSEEQDSDNTCTLSPEEAWRQINALKKQSIGQKKNNGKNITRN